MCCAFLILGGVQVVSANTAAFQITVDGVGLATLPSEKEARAAIDRFLEEQSAEAGFTVVCGEDVVIEKISSRDAVYSSPKDAATALAGGVKVLAKAVAVCVNGQPVMYVADEETARRAIEQAKNHYGSTEMLGVESVNVLEQVGVIVSNVKFEEVLTAEQAANMLLFGSAQVQFHFVETEGETFDYIANRYGLAAEDIQTANPGVDSTNMAVGEAILVSKVKPLINIQVKRTLVAQEETSFETERRDNNQMQRGETKVLTEGVPGLEEVTMEVIERNGVVASQTRVSAVTLLEPVAQVEEFGTQRQMAERGSVYLGGLGSGVLGWPYWGKGISSRFGYRSMGYHSGLDIMGPHGDAVVAAKEGTVILAEYYSAYGNLVIIDHGDGMETYYGHLSAFAVGAGEKVVKGQVVGAVGATGRTTGPHVHFEVRINGKCQDPLLFLGAAPGAAGQEEADTAQ